MEGRLHKRFEFSKGKRGALMFAKGKTRITIYIDNAVLEEFRYLRLAIPAKEGRAAAEGL